MEVDVPATPSSGTLSGGPPRPRWRRVGGELLASVVVFLVALPLCMGIAIASGAPVAAGLVTGIIGGIIVGTLAGSPLQVSGPAAGLTVIIYDLVQRHGLETLGLVVLGAGAIQVVAGVLKCGQWFRAVSPAVIEGMLAGIGVLILASQFHVMVDDQPKGSGLANLTSIPEAIAKGLPIPEWGTSEQRQCETDQLKRLAALHHDQARLRTLVGEVIPENATPDEIVAQSVELVPLALAQEQIRQNLLACLDELTAHELLSHGARGERLSLAAEEALAALAVALVDLEEQRGQRVRYSQAEAEAAVVELLGQLKNHDWAAKIGLLTIAVILLWRGLAPRALQTVPAPLVAVMCGTLAAVALNLPIIYVAVPDSLLDDLHFPSLVVFSEADWRALLQAALVVAVVASAETLLCCTAVDAMHQGPRTKYDRELVAQGIGNSICGLLGALPMTGVIVRSAANVQAGAKTRWSAVLHGVWLLVFVIFLGWLLRMIPTASLAAVLVYTGYKLINPKAVKRLWQYGRSEVGIYLATVTLVVVEDLLTGVLVGVGLSLAKLVYRFSHLSAWVERSADEHRVILHLEGAATFVRLPKLAAVLEEVPPGSELHVQFDRLDYIDHASLDLLLNWEKQHRGTGGRLVIDWETLTARFTQPGMRNGNDASPVDSHRAA